MVKVMSCLHDVLRSARGAQKHAVLRLFIAALSWLPPPFLGLRAFRFDTLTGMGNEDWHGVVGFGLHRLCKD